LSGWHNGRPVRRPVPRPPPTQVRPGIGVAGYGGDAFAHARFTMVKSPRCCVGEKQPSSLDGMQGDHVA